MSGIKLTKQKELFGDNVSDDYAVEAEQCWGDTEHPGAGHGIRLGERRCGWPAIGSDA